MKVLLENYSFDVIDLGRDVTPETVVEEAIREHVPVVGLQCSYDDNGSVDGGDDQGAEEGCALGEGHGRRCGSDAGVCGCDRGGCVLQGCDGVGEFCGECDREVRDQSVI